MVLAHPEFIEAKTIQLDNQIKIEFQSSVSTITKAVSSLRPRAINAIDAVCQAQAGILAAHNLAKPISCAVSPGDA